MKNTSGNPGDDEVKSTLLEFAKTWNEGDIHKVVSTYYINSEDTILISDKIIHGYKKILKFFEMKYPTYKEMGIISFSDVEVRLLSPVYALAMGRWSSVTEESKHFGGMFTVLYEKTTEGWKISVDSTVGL